MNSHNDQLPDGLIAQLEQKKTKQVSSDEESDDEITGDEDLNFKMLDQVRSKLKKRKMGDKERDNLDEKMTTDASENPKQESASAEYKRLKREMMETKRKKDNEGKKHSASKESDVLAAFHAEQVTYLEKKKAAQKRKGEGRDEQNLALLASFQAKLEQSPEEDEEEKDDREKLQKEDEEGDDTGWMFHKLSCENELKRARDAFIEDEDTFEIYDPRNPINKRRRESSKKSLQSKRR